MIAFLTKLIVPNITNARVHSLLLKGPVQMLLIFLIVVVSPAPIVEAVTPPATIEETVAPAPASKIELETDLTKEHIRYASNLAKASIANAENFTRNFSEHANVTTRN